MSNLDSKMEDILKNKVALRHSKFQIVNFIVNKEPTNISKLWQIVRELDSRKKTLHNLSLEIDEIKDEIEILKIESNMPYHTLFGVSTSKEELELSAIKNKMKLRKISAKEGAIKELETKIADVTAECECFVEAYENISKIQGFVSQEDEEAQKQYWDAKVQNDLHLRHLLNIPFDLEFTKTILSMPDDTKVKKQMVSLLNKVQSQMIEMKKEGEQRKNG
jgi:hypothetical protein